MTDDPTLPDIATRLDAVATAGPAHVRWEPLTALLREAAGEIRRLREATETQRETTGRSMRKYVEELQRAARLQATPAESRAYEWTSPPGMKLVCDLPVSTGIEWLYETNPVRAGLGEGEAFQARIWNGSTDDIEWFDPTPSSTKDAEDPDA